MHSGKPSCEQNDRQVQNITLPQTSFAGGKDKILSKSSLFVHVNNKEALKEDAHYPLANRMCCSSHH